MQEVQTLWLSTRPEAVAKFQSDPRVWISFLPSELVILGAGGSYGGNMAPRRLSRFPV